MWFCILDGSGVPAMRCNTKALQDGVYKIVGEMLATMVAQVGMLPHMLDSSAVEYILHGGSTNVKVDYKDCTEAEKLKEVCY